MDHDLVIAVCILELWFKAMMKESEDPEEKQILNFRQEALKTLISTIYGLYNHPKYRWYCVEASEAITAGEETF